MNAKQRKTLMGVIFIMKTYDIKPNYSELERQTGINRHTIKKYYEDVKTASSKTKNYVSKYEAYTDLSIERFALNPAITIKAVYEFILYSYPDADITYNGFKSFLRRKGIGPQKKTSSAHVFYETDPVNNYSLIGKKTYLSILKMVQILILMCFLLH